MSILPPGMDGRRYNGSQGKDGALQDWQRNASETLSRSLGGLNDALHVQRIRSAVKGTSRTVTPEPKESDSYGAASSVTASPRSIPGGEKPRERRKGLVFHDSYSTDSLVEPPRSGLSVNFHSRPRTHTIDDTPRHRSSTGITGIKKTRNRIGSVHSSSASSSFHVVEPRNVSDVSNSLGFSSISRAPPLQVQKSSSVKSGRRLVKRPSRPSSPTPAMNDAPSVDSLPFPVDTGDANKILMLMRTLCGRMRGEAEYQITAQGPWYTGLCYIDDAKGALMYEGGDNGPFHLTIIKDLRGCRVKPSISTEQKMRCLEISNRAIGLEVYLIPKAKHEYDLWLAALLCWQQIRTNTLPSSPPRTAIPPLQERRPSFVKREPSFTSTSSNSQKANIIKVAKLLIWDKGAPTSPKTIVRRSSTRDLRAAGKSSWRKVSCILQDNGEFKLLTDNDSTLLSVIQLSQLSRCAIQRLDKSVLEEEYCIAIFPQYTPMSTQLSIFRPVYIALESRLVYEVWFCLLRAFTIPVLYGPQSTEADDGDEEDEECSEEELGQLGTPEDEMFRIEKSISLRIVEAKIRRPNQKPDAAPVVPLGKSLKTEPDPSIGDYFAEVVLDGEIRARTITKTDTKNPFWREDCQFLDLPARLPRLSVVLKQKINPRNPSQGFLSSSGAQGTVNQYVEVTCGTIDVPVEMLEKGKDNETWWPIMDDQQEPLGEMFLKICHDELVVLLAKDYQPISELLHNFGSGLTVQIGQAIPSSLKPLSEILVNIFQVSGHAGEWLTTLVEDEIDGIGKEVPTRRTRWSRRIGSNESFNSSSDREQTVRDLGKSLQGEANLLFRGNSLLTQALDFHMRRLGKEYLEDVLKDKILGINSLNPDCEVDPSRMSENENINKNWTMLIQLTNDIWANISESANRCPPEIRQALKYIRAVAEDRYGDFLRTVAYTSVSGFLFLRFFCPALLNPKLFGLLRDHPQPKAQRTLTLIAKSLQALANLANFGQKEVWMEPMNRFLTSNRQGMKDFIDAVCSIPVERDTFALPAPYSTPITILARLPLTSREGFPSLPYLIDHPRNFAALVKLWLDSTDQLIEAGDLDGELLHFHNLCVEVQRRTDECLLRAEMGDRNADQIDLQWEDIVESLDSVTIQDNSNTDPDLELRTPPWSEYSSTISSGPGKVVSNSVGSVVGTKERGERQKFWESAFGKESRYQKPYDPLEPSPPSRGQSGNGKASRSFLGGLRRKKGEGKGEKGEGEKGEGKGNVSNSFSMKDGERSPRWNIGDGGMI